MALAAGTRLGAYEISGQLGTGGMGEVYRAIDTKLGREVAIKTLPDAVAQDPDRLVRFEREAKLLATLNHAHIAAVYGLDEHDGTQYLAMELVEGETLEEKLKDGPLLIEDALHLALQIAEALEAAHEKGVVHRDLKPANIMVTGDDQVKVLDFGLAKAFSGDPNRAAPLHSPTLSAAMTQQGLILGTAGYMSPEQASGQATDQRADIWAFGVVLYEMLTGLPLFSGESVPHILAAILQTEPDWSRLPKHLHPRVKLLLERCLKKKVRDRYHSIADVRVDIEDALRDPQGVTAPGPIPEPRSRRALPVAAAAIVVVAVVAAFLAWRVERNSPNSSGVQRLTVRAPLNRPVSLIGSPFRVLALSPDGKQLVYVGANPKRLEGPGWNQLELRSLSTLGVRDLPGTDGAFQPFFSPDGQWVGFFTYAGELKKVSLAGGQAITLARNLNPAVDFGVWTQDGTIVFGGDPGPLYKVSAEGGKPTALTALDATRHEGFHSFPALVPNSRAVLFTVWYRDLSDPEIDAVMLDSGKRRVVIKNASTPLLLGGTRLLFQRGQSILIAPFDAKRLRVTGPAVPLPEKVYRQNDVYSVAQLAVSQSGTLAYLPGANTARVLGIASRTGSFEPLAELHPGNYSLPRVSPDGHSIAFIASAGGQRSAVRIYDLQRKTTNVLRTGDPEYDYGLAWRPDGRSLAISSRTKDFNGIVLKSLDGTRLPLVPVPPGANRVAPGSWSPDGMHLAYEVSASGKRDIWVLTMGAKPGEKPTTTPLMDSPTSDWDPVFSPDGRWLAFASDRAGGWQIYVKRYPHGEALPVSDVAGVAPVWGPDGKELYFEGFQGPHGLVPKMMVVSVTPQAHELRLGKPVGLFDLRIPGPGGTNYFYAAGGFFGAPYDVSSHGFVMVKRPDLTNERDIVVVLNLSEQLKRLVPVK